MAHSYTPGLRVTSHALVRRERRLPLKGEVLVQAGAQVEPDTVVARTQLPGNVQTVNVAAKLSVDPAKSAETLLHPLGTLVKKGQPIASAKSLFGLMKSQIESPADGTIESVSSVTGQLILREPPIPVEVQAYVRGRISEVLAGEGVVVESQGALMQGIFGVGGETFGPIAVAVSRADEVLGPSHLKPEHRGAVVVGGAYVAHDTLMRAKEIGVAAVVVGGFDDHDLKRLLGKDLGVAITGQEDLGFTLVLTEGFGHIPMADRTFRMLQDHVGHVASVSGATQIRAGVMRPEILIPRDDAGAARPSEDSEGGLEIGALIRVIRQPYFGRLGKVVELPPELQALDSEARVRVLRVAFEGSQESVLVPRANIERIAD